MKKVIADGTFRMWHEDSVSAAVDRLQKHGYKVTEIKRVRRVFLDVFGDNVTEITYEK